MNKITVMFHQFILKQDIILYNGDKIINKFAVDLDKVVETIIILQKQYNLSEINLCGNSAFWNMFSLGYHLCGNSAFISKFKNKLINKFSNTNVQINEI